MDNLFDKIIGIGLGLIAAVVTWVVKTLLTNKEQVEIVKTSITNQSDNISELKKTVESLRKEFKDDLKELKDDLVLIYKLNNK